MMNTPSMTAVVRVTNMYRRHLRLVRQRLAVSTHVGAISEPAQK